MEQDYQKTGTTQEMIEDEPQYLVSMQNLKRY